MLLIILASVLTSPPPSGQPACAAPAPSTKRPFKGDAKRVVLISLDGFRHDYLDRPEVHAPNLRRLVVEARAAADRHAVCACLQPLRTLSVPPRRGSAHSCPPSSCRAAPLRSEAPLSPALTLSAVLSFSRTGHKRGASAARVPEQDLPEPLQVGISALPLPALPRRRLTFPPAPPHSSMATGLYPAWHGIVSNAFTFRNDTFRMSSLDPKWCAEAATRPFASSKQGPSLAALSLFDGCGGRAALSLCWLRARVCISAFPARWLGEPIWQTAARQGKKAAAVFWPGIAVARPGWVCAPPECLDYNETMPNGERVRRAIDLLSDQKPGAKKRFCCRNARPSPLLRPLSPPVLTRTPSPPPPPPCASSPCPCIRPPADVLL